MESSNPFWRRLLAALIVALAVFVAAPGESAAQDAPNPVDRDLDRYWSGREMPVIAGEQLYVTAERFEFTLYGGVLPNDDFFTYFPVGLRSTYSFNGILGVELDGAYLGIGRQNSELTDFLKEKGDIREEVDLDDQQVGRLDVLFVFSPLYGKWSFQTYKISHFDLFFVLGGGVVFTDAPVLQDNGDPEPEPASRITGEGVFGAGFRFFINDWSALRLDARWAIYPAFDEGVKVPATLTLGFSVFTPE